MKNITQGKDPAGWFRRWMRSLILGVPFARTDDITEFQVYTNWTGTANSSGYSADKVIAYGNISYGMPVQDNAVRVYGVRDKNRVIIADDIENSTDGVHSVFDPAPLSATAVRILTGVVVLLVGFVLYTLFSFIVGVGRGNLTGQSAASAARAGESFSVILSAVICGAIAVFSGKRALKNFGSNWKSAGICGLIALVFAITCISMLQNL